MQRGKCKGCTDVTQRASRPRYLHLPAALSQFDSPDAPFYNLHRLSQGSFEYLILLGSCSIKLDVTVSIFGSNWFYSFPRTVM